eukprot:Amastigsp_a842902_3.p4 type:complete len:121 gc:universal Amastigsp_a842902_3:590-228(-)
MPNVFGTEKYAVASTRAQKCATGSGANSRFSPLALASSTVSTSRSRIRTAAAISHLATCGFMDLENASSETNHSRRRMTATRTSKTKTHSCSGSDDAHESMNSHASRSTRLPAARASSLA